MDTARCATILHLMAQIDLSPDADDGSFPAALRTWRRVRGLSQFELAETVGVSTRHLSFLETGRAQPSRDMTLALCDGLVLPRAARNALLTKAGFAPIFPSTPLHDEALAPMRAVLNEMMARHAPFPALIVDRHWTMLDANDSAKALLAPLHGPSNEMNVVRMLAQNPLAAELIGDYPIVLAEMYARIRLEALESGADPVHAELLRVLERAMHHHPAPRGHTERRPLMPLTVRTPTGELRFLSAVAHFGTSEDITVRDLRLELLFPADVTTRAAFNE